MKKRFSEEKIVGILKEAESGMSVAEVSRRYGVSEATVYQWRRRFKGMDVLEVRKLRHLEQENARLKKLVAEKELLLEAMREAIEKKGLA